MEKYRVFANKIEKLEVVKETAKKVTYVRETEYLSGDKETYNYTELKESEYVSWFDTFDEAKIFLIGALTGQINFYKAQILSLEREIERTNLLTEENI